MQRPVLRREEVVLRAIQETHLDEKQGRVSSSLFKGRDISLSRLAVLSTGEIFKILRRDLDKPANALIGAAEVTVAVIEDAGGRDEAGKLIVRVVADPLLGSAPNPAHAEIPQNLSKGTSRKIIKGISRYVRPDGNVLEFPIRTRAIVSPPTAAQAILNAPAVDRSPPTRGEPNSNNLKNRLFRALVIAGILLAMFLLLA
jgi:hypothetical protein